MSLDIDSYRAKAIEWLNSVAPRFGRDARQGLNVEEDLALGRQYMRAKFDAGFSGINWPKDFGGQGLTHIEKVTFEEIWLPQCLFRHFARHACSHPDAIRIGPRVCKGTRS
jgi:alkylation response protein AidB-like acyl-CoA dehydrogenase